MDITLLMFAPLFEVLLALREHLLPVIAKRLGAHFNGKSDDLRDRDKTCWEVHVGECVASNMCTVTQV